MLCGFFYLQKACAAQQTTTKTIKVFMVRMIGLADLWLSILTACSMICAKRKMKNYDNVIGAIFNGIILGFS